MSYSRGRSRSRSLSQDRGRYVSRSLSRSKSRSRSRESEDTNNPGNNLYVTGLSTRVTKRDLENHFSTEGKVLECDLVVDPRTRESRGFGFVLMESLEDADRCIKYLNKSVLEGRLIAVEKAKRRCGRTRTPGKYFGPKQSRGDKDRYYRGRERGRSPSPNCRRGRHASSPKRRRRERSLSVSD